MRFARQVREAHLPGGVCARWLQRVGHPTLTECGRSCGTAVPWLGQICRLIVVREYFPILPKWPAVVFAQPFEGPAPRLGRL